MCRATRECCVYTGLGRDHRVGQNPRENSGKTAEQRQRGHEKLSRQFHNDLISSLSSSRGKTLRSLTRLYKPAKNASSVPVDLRINCGEFFSKKNYNIQKQVPPEGIEPSTLACLILQYKCYALPLRYKGLLKPADWPGLLPKQSHDSELGSFPAISPISRSIDGLEMNDFDPESTQSSDSSISSRSIPFHFCQLIEKDFIFFSSQLRS